MVELTYEKEINKKLNDIISNDSIIIDGLNTELNNTLIESEYKIKKVRKERNIFVLTTIGAALISLLVLIK